MNEERALSEEAAGPRTMPLKHADLLISHSYKHPRQSGKRHLVYVKAFTSETSFLILSKCPAGYRPDKQIWAEISHGKADSKA